MSAKDLFTYVLNTPFDFFTLDLTATWRPCGALAVLQFLLKSVPLITLGMLLLEQSCKLWGPGHADTLIALRERHTAPSHNEGSGESSIKETHVTLPQCFPNQFKYRGPAFAFLKDLIAYIKFHFTGTFVGDVGSTPGWGTDPTC